MANPAGAVAAPNAAGGQQQQQQQRQNPIMGIIRMIAMWYMFKTFFGGGSQKKLAREELLIPQLTKGTSLDMNLYLSEDQLFSRFDDPSALVWSVKDVRLGLEPDRAVNITYIPSKVGHHSLDTRFQAASIVCQPITQSSLGSFCDIERFC
jgi:hypothetical protein